MGISSVADCLNSPIEATIAQQSEVISNIGEPMRDCCLVQIYPTNIVDGLMKIERNSLSIGRDAVNDLMLPDGSVSRQHAVLERSASGYIIQDLGSTNGTYVNDAPIAQCELDGGEIIRIGSFIFKFLSANCIEAQYHSTVYNAMTRDGLTGAFNKSYLLDSLQHEIARSLRCKRPLSVLLMDIDHFKSINDTYGHLVGDEILREFSNRLTNTKRPDDLLCRYGGEEFVLILGETELGQAVEIAERCREHIAQSPFTSAEGPIPVTVSMGAAELPLNDGPITPSGLLKTADDRLYKAKQSGRNRVCSGE